MKNSILGWGLEVKGEIPVEAEVVDGTPPLECMYAYQFPGGRCPLLKTSSHDSPAPIRYLEFRVPVQIDYAEEQREEGTYYGFTIKGNESTFLLWTVLGDTHKHIVLEVASSS